MERKEWLLLVGVSVLLLGTIALMIVERAQSRCSAPATCSAFVQVKSATCGGNPLSCAVTLQNTGSIDAKDTACYFTINNTQRNCSEVETPILAGGPPVVVICTASGFEEHVGTLIIGEIAFDGQQAPLYFTATVT